MTYLELQNKVADYINRSDMTTQIKDAINIVLHDLEQTEWNYMSNSTTFAATTANSLTLPTRYKSSDYLYATYSGVNYILTKQSQIEINREFNNSTVTGQPTEFSIDIANSLILIRPYPDAAYSYTFKYWAKSIDLSADGDTNWWTLNQWEILLYGAVAQMWILIMDTEQAGIFNSLYEKRIKELQISERLEEFTRGSVKANGVVV